MFLRIANASITAFEEILNIFLIKIGFFQKKYFHFQQTGLSNEYKEFFEQV